MPSDPIPFADNWAYLKTELHWLERVLMVAVARQQQETQAIDRVAQTAADRATSHWWKGIITTGRAGGYDDCRGPMSGSGNRGDKKAVTGSGKQNYQQQLETRIRASHAAGIVLGLPTLCDRFGLSLVEKNLVLFALAPEVNRRYSRLYRYLQSDHDPRLNSLASVDLVLRLLCRNDVEWRRARALLVDPQRIVWQQLIQPATQQVSTFLDTPLRLPHPWLNYLLAEQPQPHLLPQSHMAGAAMAGAAMAGAAMAGARTVNPTQSWQTLVLPVAQSQQLQALCRQVKAACPDAQADLIDLAVTPPPIHQLLLLTGPSGMGKTAIAEGLAYELAQGLTVIDLAQLSSLAQVEVLHCDRVWQAPVLLIEAAHHWLGWQSTIDLALITAKLKTRRTCSGLTILTADYKQSIRPRWRQQCDMVLPLTLPDKRARQVLWQQAIPDHIPVTRGVSWPQLAAQFALSAMEIQGIAQSAIAQMQQQQATKLSFTHLKTALANHGHRWPS